ncbi:MAG: 50S ribosomal protein L6 [Chloroflexi bacterium RBG_16_68_14]|nr:MAG: 50S ribosomal protein L6 [Chloroflexi bacterium RBG_16_68_14]
MSRIGKQPIPIPPSVQVQIEGSSVTVRGPKGELRREVHPDMGLHLDDGRLIVTRPSDAPRHRALHGLTRALLANMVAGVESGFAKTLELQGVGYRAQQMGKNIQIAIGFSHPVDVKAPPDITLEVEGTSRIHVRGIDKELVGQVAAEIRHIRPPEPYKGKGIRYAGEHVRRKAGKAGKTLH